MTDVLALTTKIARQLDPITQELRVTVLGLLIDRYQIGTLTGAERTRRWPLRAGTTQVFDQDSRRQALLKDRDLREFVKYRDGDRCRYCGESVNWNDRRGPRGATYDHVDPNGGNSAENVVISCHHCNMTKGARTPGQAMMVLLPAIESTPVLVLESALESVLESGNPTASVPPGPPSSAPSRKFQIPASVFEALSKSRILGAVVRLKAAEYWQAEVRANPGVDFGAEVLKAEAWMMANPDRAPRKNYARFLHTWLSRAERAE